MIYQGHCHCQRTVFTLEADPITEAMHCNCSICRRKSLTLSEPWFGPDQLTFTRGFDQLSIYQWQDHDLNHLFCGNCGVHIGASAVSSPDHIRLNLACFDEVDLASLKVRLFDGKGQL